MVATITELSTENFPCDVQNGTGKRRIRIFYRSDTASAGSSVNLGLGTTIPGLADIEGIVYITSNGAAVSSGSADWSTTTLTLGTAVNTPEICLVGTMT